jgi:hypothetical protein
MSTPPDSPIHQRIQEQWRGICTALMRKHGITEVEISREELVSVEPGLPGGLVVLESFPDKVCLRCTPLAAPTSEPDA